MTYLNRTFSGALHADIVLYQFLTVLKLKSGSHKTVSQAVSSLLGRPVNTYLPMKSEELDDLIIEVKAKIKDLDTVKEEKKL